MLAYFYAYLLTLPILVVPDFLWAGYFMSGFYKARLPMIGSGVAWQPLAVWYPLYLLGLFFLGVAPAKNLSGAALAGAIFGLVAYATYDLVNMATLSPWPISVTAVDMIWGAVLGACVSAAAFAILGALR